MPKNRYRTGTHDASDMTDTYAVQLLAKVSDQNNIPWRIDKPSEIFREFDAQTEGGHDGTTRMIGKWNGSWYLPAVTPLMFDYIRTNWFPTNGVFETATIVTKTVYGWKCLNVTARLNLLADVGESKPTGNFMKAVRLIDFFDGDVANSGGDFNSDFNADFNLGGIL